MAEEPETEHGAGREFARPRRVRAAPRWWVLAVASVLAGVVAGLLLVAGLRPGTPGSSTLGAASSAGTFTSEGGQAPSWTLPELARAGRSLSLARFRGRPLVLNFWASWCPPCRKEMPALEHVANLVSGRVGFVGIDAQDERAAGLAFAKSVGVTYPLTFDSASVSSAYGVYGLPTTFFVTADGRIRGREVGAMTGTRLVQLLREVFGVKVPNR